MPLRFAFAGFRHGHIFDVYRLARHRSDVTIVAATEDDPTAAEAAKAAGVELTHASPDALFAAAASFDVLAVGDYFGRRGALAIRALELGKHVISDKPICTRLEEWGRIRGLSAAGKLSVGCQFDLRDAAPTRTLMRLVRGGAIGRVHTVAFTGQHPLLYGRRAAWYFEQGKHGGTLNDIAIHAFDLLPHMLSAPVAEVVAARAWNARLPQHPSFQDGAQVMLRLASGAGVIGDASYLAPDSQGYSVPQYWRFTLSGERGTLETSHTASEVLLWPDGKQGVRAIGLDPARPGGYFDDFVNEIGGQDESELTTAQVLAASRVALLAQQAADESRAHLAI